jgi:hypothetical protein
MDDGPTDSRPVQYLFYRSFPIDVAMVGGTTADSELKNSKTIRSVPDSNWASPEVKLNGAIRAVVDDDSHSPTVSGETSLPSREPLTEPVEGLSEEGRRGGAKVEIKPQQDIHPDEGRDKQRLGSLSFSENDSVWSERGASCRFLGLPEIFPRLFDGSFNHINRHVERSRKLVDKP